MDMGLKLYQVAYKVWNKSFSDLIVKERLSVGENETAAIQKIKESVSLDARDFTAKEITNIFGYEILVSHPI